MNYITIDQKNIDSEHICCCISDCKGETCVADKKAWMKERLAEGLVFRRSDTRGKVFIEYIPAENAWIPILANGYIHIDCFWVSGQYKGHGYANDLLSYCIEDAKANGRAGITALSSEKKRAYLSDPDYLKYKGFQVADTASPYFTLYYLPLVKDAPVPKIKDCAKHGTIEENGMVLYYTDQCPHAGKYARLIQNITAQHGRTLTVHKIESKEQAQNAPVPYTSYAFFYKGKFITNEIYSEKKWEQFLQEHELTR